MSAGTQQRRGDVVGDGDGEVDVDAGVVDLGTLLP